VQAGKTEKFKEQFKMSKPYGMCFVQRAFSILKHYIEAGPSAGCGSKGAKNHKRGANF